MKYTVIVEEGHESGYVAHVPALGGCVSQGETREEAWPTSKRPSRSTWRRSWRMGFMFPRRPAERDRGDRGGRQMTRLPRGLSSREVQRALQRPGY